MSFPFIADADIDSLALPADDRRRRTVALVNPLSKEEAVMRTTLVPGLLRVVRHNANRQTPDAAVFEIGHVFLESTADQPGADGGPAGTVLHDLLGAVDLVRQAVGRDALGVEPTAEAPFHPGRAARLSLDGVDVGVVGELHPRVAAAFEVPPRTLVGEVELGPFVAGGVRPRPASVPSPLPGLTFDVAVLVDQDVAAADVEAAVRAGAGERLTAVTLFDVYRGEQLGAGRKGLAFRVRLDDAERQLTDADEAAAIEAIDRAVADAVGGTLRR